MWIYANPNPCRQEEPDCVVRAISLATGQTWDRTHMELCRMSGERCTMPSVNWLWGEYLKEHGFRRFTLPETCPECVTVREFCRKYPHGTYVVCTGNHTICLIDGDWMDIWDSGDERLTFFYRKEA